MGCPSKKTTEIERLAEEEHYHDDKYTDKIGDPAHYALNPTYSIYLKMIAGLGNIKGKKILECGCGTGWITAELAALGAQVYAFDISSESVKATQTFLKKNNLGANCVVEKKSFENMDYQEGTFDCVVGFAILHHVDLEKAIPQIYRVLKPSGTAIFAEPLASNPFLNLYRKLTPQYRTPDERPLQLKKFAFSIQDFRNFSHEEFYLMAQIPLFLSNFKFFKVSRRLLNQFVKFDDFLFKKFEFIKQWAWYSILKFQK
jgi:2-polyprenyl-3-methyl-5-hydroxy-6-metoxy-1,4-benzoquinol methylase